MNNHWVSIQEVANRCCVSRPTASKKLRAGEIPGLAQHHGTTRVDRKTFEKWALSKDLVK